MSSCTCGAKWSDDAQAAAHCPTCHLTFSSPGGFDEHRQGWKQPAKKGGVCATPSQLKRRGLTTNDRGHWHRERAPGDNPPFQRVKGLTYLDD